MGAGREAGRQVGRAPGGSQPTDRAGRAGVRAALWFGGLLALVGGSVQALKVLVAFKPVGALAVGFMLVEGTLGVAAMVAATRMLSGGRGRWLVAASGLAMVLLDAGGGGAPPRVLPGLVVLAGGLVASAALAGTPVASPAVAGLPRGERVLRSALAGLGVGGQFLVAVPFLAVGLAAPPWAVAVLFIVWGALTALALRLYRSRSPLTLLLPPVTFALMYGLLLTGGSVLDWTA